MYRSKADECYNNQPVASETNENSYETLLNEGLQTANFNFKDLECN